MKYVLIGGAGFIGSNIAHLLCDQGDDVHVVDTVVGGKKENIPAKAIHHTVDMRSTDELVNICIGADCIFHLAALPRVQYSIEHPVETNEVNVGGVVSVLTAAHKAGVRRVVYSASSSAYGDQENMPLTEDMPAMPKSPYGLQKHIGELYMRLWSQIFPVETVSLRYFNVYGPRLNPEGSYALVIGRFLKQKQKGEPLTITGDGEQTRDFTHVSDVVRANLLASTSRKVGRGEVINIGAGKETSINNLAKHIGGDVVYVPARLEPKRTQADYSKATALLGWEPTVSLEEGIKDLKQKFGVE